MSLRQELQQGLAAAGIELPEAAQTKLLDFLALLKKWNRTYNLTAIRDQSAMVIHHLLDSLALLPALHESELTQRRWADVGSGAGLPGIPLAVARPDLEMTLVEAVAKKSAFQRQAKIELGLANVAVFNGRVEDMPGGSFDAIVSRAFAELPEFVAIAGHLLVPHGRLYAMKGAAPEQELNRLPIGWRLLQRTRLHVPGVRSQRNLIVLERT